MTARRLKHTSVFQKPRNKTPDRLRPSCNGPPVPRWWCLPIIQYRRWVPRHVRPVPKYGPNDRRLGDSQLLPAGEILRVRYLVKTHRGTPGSLSYRRSASRLSSDMVQKRVKKDQDVKMKRRLMLWPRIAARWTHVSGRSQRLQESPWHVSHNIKGARVKL